MALFKVTTSAYSCIRPIHFLLRKMKTKSKGTKLDSFSHTYTLMTY